MIVSSDQPILCPIESVSKYFASIECTEETERQALNMACAVLSAKHRITASEAYIVGGVIYHVSLSGLARAGITDEIGFTVRCQPFIDAYKQVGLKPSSAWIRVQFYKVKETIPSTPLLARVSSKADYQTSS